MDIPLFMPTFKARRHRTGSPWVVRPLLPGYLFADLAAKPFGPVRRCRWVIDILGTVPISISVMDAIQNTAANVCVSPRLVRGRLYRLRRGGPLADILARLEALDENGKAVVLVNLFGAERVVHVQAHDLEEQ